MSAGSKIKRRRRMEVDEEVVKQFNVKIRDILTGSVPEAEYDVKNRRETEAKVREWEQGSAGRDDRDEEITEEEFVTALAGMDNGKGLAQDGVAVEMVKLACKDPVVRKYIVEGLNRFWRAERTPEYMRRSEVKPIPKARGRVTSVDGLRDIHIITVWAKIYEKIIGDRVMKAMEADGRILTQGMFGFRHEYAAWELLLTQTETIQRRAERGLKTIILFADVVKAYPTTWLDGVLAELRRVKGVSPKMWRVIAYQVKNMIVKAGQVAFRNSRGLLTGSPWAGTLYLLMSAPLARELDRNEIGVELGGWKLVALQFADDNNSTHGDESQVVRAERIMEWYSRKYIVRFNYGPKKTSKVVMPGGSETRGLGVKGGNENGEWQSKIGEVKHYIHLGADRGSIDPQEDFFKSRAARAFAVMERMGEEYGIDETSTMVDVCEFLRVVAVPSLDDAAGALVVATGESPRDKEGAGLPLLMVIKKALGGDALTGRRPKALAGIEVLLGVLPGQERYWMSRARHLNEIRVWKREKPDKWVVRSANGAEDFKMSWHTITRGWIRRQGVRVDPGKWAKVDEGELEARVWRRVEKAWLQERMQDERTSELYEGAREGRWRMCLRGPPIRRRMALLMATGTLPQVAGLRMGTKECPCCGERDSVFHAIWNCKVTGTKGKRVPWSEKGKGQGAETQMLRDKWSKLKDPEKARWILGLEQRGPGWDGEERLDRVAEWGLEHVEQVWRKRWAGRK